jgi:glutamate:GABA antiporter
MGFLAVWCQFAMTIFYYPSLLGFVASTLAYVINPDLASSGLWTASVIVICYWAGVYISSQGTKSIAGLASGGLIIGTLIPGSCWSRWGSSSSARATPRPRRWTRATSCRSGRGWPAWC